MRRLALSVVTGLGLALLTACGSGGGYGFSTSGNANGSIDQVVFTAGKNAQANNFIVVPPNGVTATPLLQVDALGQKGTGPFAIVVPDSTFLWGARFVDPAVDSAKVASYQVTSAGTTKPCPKKPSITPKIPIFIAATGLGTTVLGTSQASRTVFVGGPSVMPAADNATGYCIVLNATHVGDGVQGSQTILVSNNP